MEKKEIIKKENKKKDPYIMEVQAKGCEYASVTMIILAFIYFVYEIATDKGSNPAFYSLITVFNGVTFGYRALKIEENRKLNYFTSFIWMLLTVLLILEYFKIF